MNYKTECRLLTGFVDYVKEGLTDEDVYRGLVHKTIEKMSMEDLEVVFDFKKLDPNETYIVLNAVELLALSDLKVKGETLYSCEINDER